uniref:NADH-cytochrome b5 reductase n=1 Tax=Chromera velia CCMP2878 TaxID=1169474 RepID=A0A0G4I2N1_9ALVE|eukprot:Cvel_1720.t1-p1 / transcript=Cvel_1720.t1 / gene=Cvel_1720 / organism=Chromera_velia_CCMP2878 / gene_product=NADH-cytochrome b5 reductase 2, putative / transcript_product=NADH-cytochrome b5 reductase 2, putative / location=Cvel_scaffold62:86646-87587(+) / protein_length=314 / sequence_SO=supercontig / SO=protein_coding / is_pseudo=false
MTTNGTGSSLPLVLGAAAVAAIGGVAVLLFLKKTKKFLSGERQKIELIDKITVSHDTTIFRLGLPSKSMILGLPIGKHFKLFAPNKKGVEEGQWNKRKDIEAKFAEIERKYTPTTGDETKGHVDLMIKVYKGGVKPEFPDGGKMSQYLDSLNVGDTIDIQGPVGKIEYHGNGKFTNGKVALQQKKHVGMLAGGTGITPMLQIADAILRDPSDPTTVSLLYANQTEDDILLRSKFEELTQTHPDRFKVWYTLDRPPKSGWKYSTGFITKDMIAEHLPKPGPDSVVLMCGPPPMIKFACHANLDELKWDKSDRLEF